MSNLTDVFSKNQVPPRYWDDLAEDILFLMDGVIFEIVSDDPDVTSGPTQLRSEEVIREGLARL